MDSSLSRRSFLKTAAGLTAGFLLSSAQKGMANPGAPSTLWHGSRNLRRISLSIDDCYLLDYLQELEALSDDYPSMHLTFFPVGMALQNTNAKDEGIWRRLLDQGHEVGYHSYNHDEELPPSKMSESAMISDYQKWYEAYSQVLGEQPKIRFARPPFGDLSYSFIYMCEKNKLIPAMWSTSWGKTFNDMEAEVEKLINGDIVLLHVRNPDVDNLQKALPFLLRTDLKMVTLSELLLVESLKLPDLNCAVPEGLRGRQIIPE